MNKTTLFLALLFLFSAVQAARFLEQEETKVIQDAKEPQKEETNKEVPIESSSLNEGEASNEKINPEQKEEVIAEKPHQQEEAVIETNTPQEKQKVEQNAEQEENKNQSIPVLDEKQPAGEQDSETEQSMEKPKEEEKSWFGMSFGFVFLMIAGIFVFFVGFYRYNLQKYKIPPFSPPSFCPNFLFPRPENDPLMEDYYIQSELGIMNSQAKYNNIF